MGCQILPLKMCSMNSTMLRHSSAAASQRQRQRLGGPSHATSVLHDRASRMPHAASQPGMLEGQGRALSVSMHCVSVRGSASAASQGLHCKFATASLAGAAWW